MAHKSTTPETVQQSEEQRQADALRDQWALWVGDALIVLRRAMHSDSRLMASAEGRIAARRAIPGRGTALEVAGQALAGKVARNASLTSQEARAATDLHGRMVAARDRILAALSPGDAPTELGLVSCSPAGAEVCESWDHAYSRLTSTWRKSVEAARTMHSLGLMRGDPPADHGAKIERKKISEEQRMSDADELAARICP